MRFINTKALETYARDTIPKEEYKFAARGMKKIIVPHGEKNIVQRMILKE